MSDKPELSKYFKLMKEHPKKFENSGSLYIVTDKNIIREYIKKTGKRIGVLYESPYRMMVVDLVYNEPGQYFTYERLLPVSNGVGVVCVPRYNGKYLLLKQYRHATRDVQYGFPRGFGEDNLTGVINAAKELGEEMEAGISSQKLIGKVVSDNGLCGDAVEIYLCEINSYEKKIGCEEIEDVLEVTLDELTKMITNNQITDGFTLSAYGYLMANLI